MSLDKLWELVKELVACCGPRDHKESDTTTKQQNPLQAILLVGLEFAFQFSKNRS